uniref:Cyanate hydratase n=1 Tax=Chlamydomonas leiostraca TaxID=1034604 RepID=A0A7S0RVE6_9CHLO|mmetsp:Transcript_31251/g.79688  ORF Transcript_31251/g.79688 Transcript_31251/m.79688 type:complete len:193 (+) Transcript_31251:70-648(+)
MQARMQIARATTMARMQRARVVPSAVQSLAGPSGDDKSQLVKRLLNAKEATGKSFTQIAQELGCTNVYAAQLFYNQSQLKQGQAAALKKAVPSITDEDMAHMMRAPTRRFDPALLQEPAIYRLYEAIMHGGDALKALINEECGDGIMSAIDFYCDVDTMPGKHGEKRVVITLNGKYLPFVAQTQEDNVARRQ